jgi:hypothetical protein
MTLPDSVALCDAVELAAIVLQKPLFDKDLTKQFFPGQTFADVEGDIKDIFALAKARQAAIPNGYPFTASDHSITFQQPHEFNAYTFLLLGRALEFGGPVRRAELQRNFRRFFEDVVSWSLRKSGFSCEVLSEPRGFRGLHTQLAPALREISNRFKEAAVLREDRLTPGDNDLDVDVLAVPILGNASRGGWPIVQIQCASGDVKQLEAKLGEGALTFATVWESGFFPGSRIRAVATPIDLLKLSDVHWLRLGQAGWVLDRTRIAYLGSTNSPVPLLNEVSAYWDELWAARTDIAWQTGWQQTS